MSNSLSPPLSAGEWAAAVLLGVVAAAGVLVWSTVELAGLLHQGRWPHVTTAALAHGLAAGPRHLRDPRSAFPPALRASLPGAAGFYLSLAIVVAGSGGLGALGSRALGSARRARRGYAAPSQVRAHLSAAAVRRRAAHDRPGLPGRTRPDQVGLALGRDVRSGQRLWGSVEDSYLYLGPPRAGKGVHLVIGQTLDAPGAVLVTATRPDTLHHTLALRSELGPVMVFDPQHLAGDVPTLRWAPQHGCTDPLVAITRARALAAGAQLTAGTTTQGEFWEQMTAAVLRGYLHAAALSGRSMRDVLGWAARPTDPTPVRLLRAAPGAVPGWAEELAAQAGSDPKQRDSVWAGVRRAVDSLADPRVLDACSPPAARAFDAARFLRERGSLYLVGSTGAQLSVAPLITALVEDIVDAARKLAAASRGGRLDPPAAADARRGGEHRPDPFPAEPACRRRRSGHHDGSGAAVPRPGSSPVGRAGHRRALGCGHHQGRLRRACARRRPHPDQPACRRHRRPHPDHQHRPGRSEQLDRVAPPARDADRGGAHPAARARSRPRPPHPAGGDPADAMVAARRRRADPRGRWRPDMTAGYREEIELLRQQVDLLYARFVDLDGLEVRPVNWSELDADSAAEQWAALAGWVDWFVARYQLGETLPCCWYAHPPILEELSALHTAWCGAYCDPAARAGDGVAFHDMAERVLDRIRHADRAGCASAGAHREDIAAPVDSHRIAARAEAIRADIAARPRPSRHHESLPATEAIDAEANRTTPVPPSVVQRDTAVQDEPATRRAPR